MAALPNTSSELVEVLNGDQTTCLTTQDPAQLGLPSQPKRHALPRDWEQHRERIGQLYLGDKRTLKEVIKILLEQHGHSGSTKQYKDHLKQWNFDQKYKKHQLVRKKKTKRAKPQSSEINHSFITPADAHDSQIAIAGPAYIQNTAHENQPDNPEDWQIPAAILQSWPPYQNFGMHPGTPFTTHLSSAEQIYSLTKQHIETSFNYVWERDSSGTCVSIKCTPEDIDLPEAYFDLIRSAVLLFSQQSPIEGRLVMAKAYALVQPILKSGNVRALNFFWASLAYLIQFGHQDLVTPLIGYICDMAQIVLQPSHAVARLFNLLISTDMADLETLVHNTWQVTADAFQGQLPQLHPEYVRHQCDLIFRIYGTRSPDDAETKLRKLLQECGDMADVPELSQFIVLNALGYNSMNSKNWAQAAQLGKQLEDRAKNGQGTNVLVYQFGGLEIQGRALNKMGLWEHAVECLAKATPMIAEEWGSQDPWRIELMALQQEWLRENGSVQEADKIKAEIVSLAQEINTE